MTAGARHHPSGVSRAHLRDLEHLLVHHSERCLATPGAQITEALARAFRFTEAAIHRPERLAPRGWAFDFAFTRGLAPAPWSAFIEHLRASAGGWASYDPLRPAAAQRNRALRLVELDPSARRAQTLKVLFPDAPTGEHDQLRVLVCDGPLLLGWVGGFRAGRFSASERDALTRLSEPFRSWLVRARWARQLETIETLHVGFERALDAVGASAAVVDARGRVLHASEAFTREASAAGVEVSALASAGDRAGWSVTGIEAAGMPQLRLLVRRRPAPTLVDRAAAFAAEHRLTPRQREVLERVAFGEANKLIAERLGCAEGTIEAHLSALYARTATRGRAELLARLWEKK